MLDLVSTDASATFRNVPSLTGTAPGPVDLDGLPGDPLALFHEWWECALSAGVAEPAAATLATVDAAGLPDSRTLILKGVDAAGWAFAGPASSRKGQQLRARPAAALNLWWQPLLRAVRVRGPVVEASAEDCEADLAERSAAARAAVAPGDWRLWRLRPDRFEFWQGSPDRQHVRVIYHREANQRWRMDVTRGEVDVVTAGPGC